MITSHARAFSAVLLRAQVNWHRNHFLKQSIRLTTSINSGNMKRKATESLKTPKAKRIKEPLPEYCDVAPQTDEHGSIVWPAAAEAIESARSFLREWYA